MHSLLDCPIPEHKWREETSPRNGASITHQHSQNGTSNSTTVARVGAWEPAVLKIMDLQHLSYDWDGQGAAAPSSELLESAIGLALTLQEHGVEPPVRVVPGPGGEVIFEWQYQDGTYAEIEIDHPLHADVMFLEPGQAAKFWTLPTE